MPTGDDIWLVDTSAALALVVTDHEHHEATFAALADRRLGLAGHAAFETYSVLTRLPGSQRLSPSVAGRLLSANFPSSRYLDAAESAALLARLGTAGLAGGAVYDALVAEAAVRHDLPLVSRDRRAARTYARTGVRLELLEPAG
jgi:predicted nucleic acid-binding protein